VASAPTAPAVPSPAPAPPWLAWLCLGTVYVVWGSTYLAIRVMVRTVPPLLGAGLRYLVAGALLALALRLRRGRGSLGVDRRQVLSAVGVGSFLLFGGNGLVTVAERHVPSGLAALLVASVPLWVVALRPVLGERTGRLALVGTALGFVGVGLLVLPGNRPGGAPLGAMLLVVLAALSWASGSLLSRRVALPREPFLSTAVQMLGGGAVMTVVGAASGELGSAHPGSLSGESIAAFAYLVLAGSLAAFTAYAWLLQHVPIGRVATYAYVNPVVAVALGWLVLGEPIGTLTAVAAALVVGSVAITVRGDQGGAGAPSRG